MGNDHFDSYLWQKECLKLWQKNHGRGIVQAATGTGKTRLALAAARYLNEMAGQKLKVKIVVPTNGLMYQWMRELKSFLAKKQPTSPTDIQKEIGLRGAGQKGRTDRRYMIYVINSARYELARQILAELKKGESVLLIADECHHYTSGQNRLIFEFLPYIESYESRFFSLGLSATIPSGEDQKYLNEVLGKTIYTYGTSQAAALGTVCPYDIFHISLSFQKNEKEQYQSISRQMQRLYQDLTKKHPFLIGLGQKERYLALQQIAGSPAQKTAKAAASYLGLSYKRKSLVCLAQSRISCTLFLIETLGYSQKILIFGERISQADALYGLLEPRCPGKVGRYHSQMGSQANRNTLLRFRDGDIRILIACKALDEGIDIPDASIGIVLSGTSGQRQRTQRLGRIIRKNAGKERASLYYLHITETMEDAFFLPGSGKHTVFDLEYQADTQQLVHPLYDRPAKKWLDSLRLGAVDERQLAEAERCLNFGKVRSDWKRPLPKIDSCIAGASDTRERNYWICMKKIAEEIR